VLDPAQPVAFIIAFAPALVIAVTLTS